MGPPTGTARPTCTDARAFRTDVPQELRRAAPAVSRPPTDGWPRQCLVFSSARTADRMSLHGFLLGFAALEGGTEAAWTLTGAACVAAREMGPNVEVSGGLTRAQRALARPLDRQVRFREAGVESDRAADRRRELLRRSLSPQRQVIHFASLLGRTRPRKLRYARLAHADRRDLPTSTLRPTGTDARLCRTAVS